ncbi:MAG: asparagine--tRNA ligase [Candidatus Micrarchaeia archaeon]
MFTPIGFVLDGKAAEGESVSLRGWVHRARASNNLAFVVMRDSTGTIQCAVKKDSVPENDFEDARKVFIESAAEVSGTVHRDERAPGGWELRATMFRLTHHGEAFPITEHQSPELLLDKRHLWLRSQKLTNAMKARDHIVRYLREYFQQQGFWEVSPPIITKSGCEGGSTLFELDYFGEKAYLSQSGQLYNEAFITSLEKVFILAPSFRAEKSRTVKHLTEYWHLEEEAAHYDNEDNMRLQEELVSYVARKLAENDAPFLRHFNRKTEELFAIEPPFHHMTYDEAVETCGIEWGDDFGVPQEEKLTEGLEKPLFVTRFPAEIKPFYMATTPDGKYALNADVLAPEGHGEIIGGSQREWNYDALVNKMRAQGLDLKEYEWYLDLRRYGSVPHSGFGLGIERLVKWLLNLEHIRDAVPFPRVINRAYP